MSIYLILSLSILLFGAAIVAVLAWRWPHFAPKTAGVMLALVLLVWLFAGRELPLESGAEQTLASLLSFSWRLDQLGWELGLILLLMMVSVVVVSLAHYDRQDWTVSRPAREKVLFPAILLVSATAVLTVWAQSVGSLLTTWVVLSLTWLLLLWSMTDERVTASRLLPRASALLLGALFLWLAVAAAGGQGSVYSVDGSWSGRATYLLLLAAIAPLGALPLQWWRPLAWSLPAETSAIVHLAPVVAGGSLLARTMGHSGAQESGLLLIASALGLISILAGIGIAWMYVASPTRSLSGLALAQAGVVVLAAAWVGSNAALAATRVLVLAISGLFLAARWSPRRLPWPAVLPLLALAGFPLTAGVDGLTSIYNAWLDAGSVVLLIIGALLSTFLLAAGMLAVRREMPSDELAGRRMDVKARHYLALALPSLGLLALPNQSFSEYSVVAWVAVVMASGGSLVLNRFEAQIHDAQLSLRRALHLGFAGRRLMRFSADVASGLDSFIRETAAILEGEGGMLWVLVFLVVIWLARQ